MQFWKLNFNLVLAAGLWFVLTIQPVCAAGKFTVVMGNEILPGYTVVGLQEVTKRGRLHHNWHYVIMSPEGDTKIWTTESKLKGVKDLRKYEDVHPKRYAFQQWCTRWQSAFSVGSAVVGVAGAVAVPFAILFKL